MIYGFENETAPLNEVENKAAKIIAYCLQHGHTGKENAVTAERMCTSLARQDADFRDNKGRPYLNGARIRKIINHIRTSGMVTNLIAGSKGYYISNDPDELRAYIQSLRQRADAITAVANSMERVAL